jgi:AcrR family transcriptional regulator
VSEYEPRSRGGRPRGRTAEGLAAERHLYEVAVGLIAERGYDAATLRDMAARARVSPTLLYRYFPSKRAVVVSLHDELSNRFADAAAGLGPGRWRDRFVDALELELDVMRPHRRALRELVPLLVAESDDARLGPPVTGARARVQGVFARVVSEAIDAPSTSLAEALGRVLYLVRATVILWWLLDRSPDQRATTALVSLVRHMLPTAGLALRLGAVRGYLMAADVILADAVFEEPPEETEFVDTDPTLHPTTYEGDM